MYVLYLQHCSYWGQMMEMIILSLSQTVPHGEHLSRSLHHWPVVLSLLLTKHTLPWNIKNIKLWRHALLFYLWQSFQSRYLGACLANLSWLLLHSCHCPHNNCCHPDQSCQDDLHPPPLQPPCQDQASWSREQSGTCSSPADEETPRSWESHWRQDPCCSTELSSSSSWRVCQTDWTSGFVSRDLQEKICWKLTLLWRQQLFSLMKQV